MVIPTLSAIIASIKNLDDFDEAAVMDKVHVRRGDALVLSGSLVDGSGTPTSDFDFCVIAPELDDRFFRESFPRSEHMRYYTQGDRVKESFDYLPGSLIGINVEYWTQAEIRELLAAHHRLYEYMTLRARKSSAFGHTTVDFRLLSRLTYAVPLLGSDAFADATSALNTDEICYTAFRTAVGSYPDFRDFAGIYAQADYDLALIAARKLGTDTVRGLTHLYGNSNRNPKYLRRFVMRLPSELTSLMTQFLDLQLADISHCGDARAACLAWLDLMDAVFDAIRSARDTRASFPSAADFLSRMQAELHDGLEWSAELRNEYSFRAREAIEGMPRLSTMLESLVNRTAVGCALPLEGWAAGRPVPLGENNQTDI